MSGLFFGTPEAGLSQSLRHACKQDRVTRPRGGVFSAIWLEPWAVMCLLRAGGSNPAPLSGARLVHHTPGWRDMELHVWERA